jgi:RNA polymerase sigma-70 factor (ECF subfamily)
MAVEIADEQTLIDQVQCGDPAAFQALYHAYFPRVYAYVAYRVGRKEDAEDITAETFTRVVEGVGRFRYRGEGSFAAWVFRIARSQVSQFYRKHHAAREPVPLDAVPDLRSSAPSPDQVVVEREQFTRLREVIGTLSPRRQEIVTLKFFGGLGNQEIAAVLGLNERTIASHLCRALEDLKRIYRVQETPA